MLSYEWDGSVLLLTARENQTEFERSITYGEIVRDDRVPNAALVMLDLRRADDPDGPADIERRGRQMTSELGAKLGTACAVIAPPRLTESAEFFQSMSEALGIRIELFRDEPEARLWLDSFR